MNLLKLLYPCYIGRDTVITLYQTFATTSFLVICLQSSKHFSNFIVLDERLPSSSLWQLIIFRNSLLVPSACFLIPNKHICFLSGEMPRHEFQLACQRNTDTAHTAQCTGLSHLACNKTVSFNHAIWICIFHSSQCTHVWHCLSLRVLFVPSISSPQK